MNAVCTRLIAVFKEIRAKYGTPLNQTIVQTFGANTGSNLCLLVDIYFQWEQR